MKKLTPKRLDDLWKIISQKLEREQNMEIMKALLTKLERQSKAATATSTGIAELEALNSNDTRIIKLLSDLKQKLTGQLHLVQATQDQVKGLSELTRPSAGDKKERQHKN